MNTQKIFLFVAIFLTIFILWDKWEITQAIDANGNVVSGPPSASLSSYSSSFSNNILIISK